MHQFIGGIPIYQQIVSELKGRMLNGTLRDGDRLPSVRELAEEFGVNPNTVQRVFSELEREGLTSTKRGVGTYVSFGQGGLETLKNQAARQVTEEFIRQVTRLGLSKDEAQAVLDNAWPQGGNP